MPHREAAAELGRKADQVELGGELAMVALGGLLQAVEVILERLLRLPRRAVDALQHRALLVATPIGARDLLQLEVAEPAGRRDVRADAHVDELVGVAIGADRVAGDLAGVELVGGAAARGLDALDDLALVRLVGEQLQRLLGRHLGAHERLVGLDDLRASRPRSRPGPRR